MLEIVKIKCPKEQESVKCPFSRTPTRIVIHNTANDAPAKNEVAYMQRNDNEVSFHFAVDDNEIIQGIDLERNAWHAGDGRGKGNMEGIAIEICYSKSGGERFEKAQENAAELTAYLLNQYGWGIDKVTKHEDYNGKHCPHRTLDDYGWDYFLQLVKNNMQEDDKPAVTEPADKKSNEAIAKEVIAGKWGNGAERKQRLTDAGYNYSDVQAKVNELVSKKPEPTPPKKSNAEIAQEVMQGKWGNGQDRKNRLAAAGYNYAEVQAEVNKLVAPKPQKKSNEEIAREVIAGKWGNGQERKDRLAEAGYDSSAIQKIVNRLL